MTRPGTQSNGCAEEIPSRVELEAALRSACTDRAYGLARSCTYGAPYLSKVVYQLLLKSAFRLCEPVQHKGGTLFLARQAERRSHALLFLDLQEAFES